MKRYHNYSEEELRLEYGDPIEIPTNKEDYIMILHTWRSGHCGVDIKGTAVFHNMLNALNYVKDELKEIVGYMSAGEIETRLSVIDEAIKQIKEWKIDNDVKFPDIGFQHHDAGVMCYACGYWSDAAPKVIEHIKTDTDYLVQCLEDEHDNEADEEYDDEMESEYEEEAEKLASSFDLDQYMKDKNIESKEFFKEFISICEDYSTKINV